MSSHSFIVLPIIAVALFTIHFETPPPIQELAHAPVTEVEYQTEVPEVEEVNPEIEEIEAREIVPKVAPPVMESRGRIHYTQSDVRLYPALEAICTCESGKQFLPNGEVVRGHVNPQDIGMCQINLKYHGATSEAMGLDVFDEADNIRYANWLYDQQGPQPWFWSYPCHGIK